MNGDGLEDLIVGDYSGYINMYTRKTDGTLNTKVQLKTASGPIQNKANWEDGIYPAIADWNNDGLKDMVVAFHHYGSGDITKCVTLFLNVGSATNPLFEEKGDILAGGKPINQFWFQCPQVADLNKDGKKDLLLGYSGWNGASTNGTGYIEFFENSGTDAAPVLKAGVKLMLKDGTPIQDKGLKNLNNLCVVNWDDDGVWDLLVIHEKWTGRGEPQQPTLRILKGWIPGTDIKNKESPNVNVSLPCLAMSGPRVVLENYEGMGLTIYTVTGKLIIRYDNKSLKAATVQKDLAGLSSGTYIWYFNSQVNKGYSGKIIINGQVSGLQGK